MTVPHNECTAFNCVLCHAWAPKETRPQSIKRGWKRNLKGFSYDQTEGDESQTMLTLDGLLDSIQPDQEAGVPLVILPDTAQDLVVHCLGYNEANLVHQLEAKAIKPKAILNLEEWLALTPYMMLDAEGKSRMRNAVIFLEKSIMTPYDSFLKFGTGIMESTTHFNCA